MTGPLRPAQNSLQAELNPGVCMTFSGRGRKARTPETTGTDTMLSNSKRHSFSFNSFPSFPPFLSSFLSLLFFLSFPF